MALLKKKLRRAGKASQAATRPIRNGRRKVGAAQSTPSTQRKANTICGVLLEVDNLPAFFQGIAEKGQAGRRLEVWARNSHTNQVIDAYEFARALTKRINDPRVAAAVAERCKQLDQQKKNVSALVLELLFDYTASWRDLTTPQARDHARKNAQKRRSEDRKLVENLLTIDRPSQEVRRAAKETEGGLTAWIGQELKAADATPSNLTLTPVETGGPNEPSSDHLAIARLDQGGGVKSVIDLGLLSRFNGKNGAIRLRKALAKGSPGRAGD